MAALRKISLAIMSTILIETLGVRQASLPTTLAPRVFEPLPLGTIAPEGWILEQLLRQASSLSGYLSSTRNLGGYHGDSNVVNMTKWLGGPGGGPGYISSNDQWFPYWANGNVPLVSLLRAANALDRLPADLPLPDIIDSGMQHVLHTAMPRPGYDHLSGALASGNDVAQHNMTTAQAEAYCSGLPTCLGFTFEGPANASGVLPMYFKSALNSNHDTQWSTYAKRTGWVSGHLLSEGGTQIVQSLTQWAEDRPTADRKAVAKVVLAHLGPVAACISPETVQSWAATRWSSVNTLLDYALDRILPEFGDDPDITPLGRDKTAAMLLKAAHHMGRVGFDYAAYYGEKPNPRSANKSVPHGSVPDWNVYDHGVNNAEGALRWPGELYRLNGSLQEGIAAMDLVTTKLDLYQGQVQGTMCADEVFCGRDPERGTETCTVVEMMASYEQSFASLGHLPLMDRVERLAFNALPAALTADMWTHVYVQQANSVYAGVSHPHSTRGAHGHHAHHAALHASLYCPRASCSGGGHGGDSGDGDGVGVGGGPAAFSEIQKSNYFGASHFPCCITNFPQGWPKFAQSAVLWQPASKSSPEGGAIVIASLLPLRATVAQAAASLHILTSYPFGDTARIAVTAERPTVVRIRIPSWAVHATVDGRSVGNGTLATVQCPQGNSTILVGFHPGVRVEHGWGDTLKSPHAASVAVTRGPLVFALHPTENRTVVRTFNTTPAYVGSRSRDYVISTRDPWSYALDLSSQPSFVNTSSPGWSLKFPFDDSGFPFSVHATGRLVRDWGYWKGSNITNPPPPSPVDPSQCGGPVDLQLVPFGSTNIRISVFPYVL